MAHAQLTDPLTPGRPAPTLAAEPASLALALPTATLLVDYAARGKTVPTAWPQTAANDLDPALLEKALAVRAVLGHGDGLRAYLLPGCLPTTRRIGTGRRCGPGWSRWTSPS